MRVNSHFYFVAILFISGCAAYERHKAMQYKPQAAATRPAVATQPATSYSFTLKYVEDRDRGIFHIERIKNSTIVKYTPWWERNPNAVNVEVNLPMDIAERFWN